MELIRRNKVVTWGTFDLLHEGHYSFLKNASELGSLSVIVVPDRIVFKNKNRLPVFSEKDRCKNIMRLKWVDSCHIDSLEDGLYSVINLDPDVFCFGYDQNSKWEERLIYTLQKQGCYPSFKRLGVFGNGIHSSDILKQSFSDWATLKQEWKAKYKNQ
ncbi:adenylyltransferase/cytidyltransferase family protein [bacterium]|nr:adenylyltransferase/cytidyltransferase family protein [bacterium]